MGFRSPPLEIDVDSSPVGSRGILDLIAGTGITLTGVDTGTDVEVTIDAAAAPPSGAPPLSGFPFEQGGYFAGQINAQGSINASFNYALPVTLPGDWNPGEAGFHLWANGTVYNMQEPGGAAFQVSSGASVSPNSPILQVGGAGNAIAGFMPFVDVGKEGPSSAISVTILSGSGVAYTRTYGYSFNFFWVPIGVVNNPLLNDSLVNPGTVIGDMLRWGGSSWVKVAAPVSAGQFLKSNADLQPVWV